MCVFCAMATIFIVFASTQRLNCIQTPSESVREHSDVVVLCMLGPLFIATLHTCFFSFSFLSLAAGGQFDYVICALGNRDPHGWSPHCGLEVAMQTELLQATDAILVCSLLLHFVYVPFHSFARFLMFFMFFFVSFFRRCFHFVEYVSRMLAITVHRTCQRHIFRYAWSPLISTFRVCFSDAIVYVLPFILRSSCVCVCVCVIDCRYAIAIRCRAGNRQARDWRSFQCLPQCREV